MLPDYYEKTPENRGLNLFIEKEFMPVNILHKHNLPHHLQF